MIASTPQRMHEVFSDALNAGDMETLLTLYEPGAHVIAEPGKSITDHSELRSLLAHFVSLNGRIDVTTGSAVTAGDITLMHGDWTFVGSDPKSGAAVQLSGHSTEVLRRQPDGRWLYVVDLFDDV